MPRSTWQKTLLVDLGLAGKNFPKSGSTTTSNSNQNAKNAFAVAGDMSINVSLDTVEAAIRDAGLVIARTIAVTANNDSGIYAAAGSAAMANNGSSNSMGIAGSVTFNWLQGSNTCGH